MTTPTVLGSKAARIIGDVEEALLMQSKTLTTMTAHLIDGNTTDALRLAVALKDEHSELLRIVDMMLTKRFDDAEAAAARLTTAAKK